MGVKSRAEHVTLKEAADALMSVRHSQLRTAHIFRDVYYIPLHSRNPRSPWIYTRWYSAVRLVQS